MTRRGSADVGFLLSGGYDLLGTTTTLDIKREAETEETTVLGVGDEEHAATGLKLGSLTQEGFFDDAADKSNDAMVGLAERPLVVGMEGNTIGQAFTGFKGAVQHIYHRIASRGAFHRANAEYKANAGVEEGKIVHAHTEETAASGDTDSNAVDGGAQADAVSVTSSSVADPTVITTAAAHGLLTGDTVLIAGHSGSTPDINGVNVATVLTPTTFTIPVNVTVGGTGGTSARVSSRSGAGYLAVSALTLGGYDSVGISLRDSDDNITFVQLITFTTVTASPVAERKVIAAKIEQYVSIYWGFTGAGSGQAVTFMAGLIRN